MKTLSFELWIEGVGTSFVWCWKWKLQRKIKTRIALLSFLLLSPLHHPTPTERLDEYIQRETTAWPYISYFYDNTRSAIKRDVAQKRGTFIAMESEGGGVEGNCPPPPHRHPPLPRRPLKVERCAAKKRGIFSEKTARNLLLEFVLWLASPPPAPEEGASLSYVSLSVFLRNWFCSTGVSSLCFFYFLLLLRILKGSNYLNEPFVENPLQRDVLRNLRHQESENKIEYSSRQP